MDATEEQIEYRRVICESARVLFGIDADEKKIVNAHAQSVIFPILRNRPLKWADDPNIFIIDPEPQFAQVRIDLRAFCYPERNIPLIWIGYSPIINTIVVKKN